jgi:hypothetical protein
LQRETLDILVKAKASGEFHIALFAIRDARANAELLERCLERERYEASTAGQVEHETQRANEQARWLREHPAEKMLLADLKRRNQLREARRLS